MMVHGLCVCLSRIRLVVFTRVSDLMIYIIGSGVLVDELVLSELLSAFIAVRPSFSEPAMCIPHMTWCKWMCVCGPSFPATGMAPSVPVSQTHS